MFRSGRGDVGGGGGEGSLLIYGTSGNKTPTMYSPTDDRMTPEERRAGASLASIYALRMLGLFIVLPVFSLYGRTLPGGDDVLLVGLALGAYGLTQACLQIPFGTASDRFGRKPVIVFGLVLFVIGSVWAALAPDIHSLIAARVVQGAGAISAAITALAADLTREQHRTKVMAMIGSSIGLTFALSLVIAPPLYQAIGMPGIFALTAALSLAAIGVVLKVVPAEPPRPEVRRKTRFAEVLAHPQLLRLNFGVFALHVMQTALWVVVPAALVGAGGLPAGSHWQVYLPAVLLSFVIMVPAVIAAERRGKMKPVFSGAVLLLVVVQLGFYFASGSLWALAGWLTLFFVAFNILEATQPSLISRIAPPDVKGAALGLYNTTQSIGLFLGGAAGGALLKYGGAGAVHAACVLIGLCWLVLAATMTIPPSRAKLDPVAA